jgi:hypothetical protein
MVGAGFSIPQGHVNSFGWKPGVHMGDRRPTRGTNLRTRAAIRLVRTPANEDHVVAEWLGRNAAEFERLAKLLIKKSAGKSNRLEVPVRAP